MVARLKFPEEDAYIVEELFPSFVTGQHEHSVAHTVLKCIGLFNDRYLPPSELSAEEHEAFLMDRAASLKNWFYNYQATLKNQGPGSSKPTSVGDDGMVGDDTDMVAKLKASRHDLQLGRKVAKELLVNKSDDTRERMETLACENSQAKKYRPEKGSPEATLRNIDMLEAMTMQLVDIASEAGWVGSIQLASMCPGEFNPRTYLFSSMNFGENEGGHTFAQHYAKYSDHVQTPFLEFVCSSFSPEKCEEFRKLMATTKKSRQKRPRQHDDSDVEDFMNDINAVEGVSDEESMGGPSEPTKRSKKKVTKGQKKPSRKKTKKTADTADTGSASHMADPMTSSTAIPVAPVTASSTAEPPPVISIPEPVTTSSAAEPPIASNTVVTTGSAAESPVSSRAVDPTATAIQPGKIVFSATPQMQRRPTALSELPAAATRPLKLQLSSPICKDGTDLGLRPMAGPNQDFDMTELGDPFKDFMDMEWVDWDGVTPYASTGPGFRSTGYVPHGLFHGITSSLENSAILTCNQWQQAYTWQQPSNVWQQPSNVWQQDLSFSAPSQNSANYHPFTSTNTPVNFPNQVPPSGLNSADYNAFTSINTPVNFPNQVAAAPMSMPVPAKNSPNQPGAPAAEIEGNAVNSSTVSAVPMTDIENLMAEPQHANVVPVNDNTQQLLTSHSQDGIQAPRPCGLEDDQDHRQMSAGPTVNMEEELPSEKENVRPVRERRTQTHREVPPEVEEAESVLQSCDLGKEYTRCVDHWKEFEMSMTVKEGRLASRDRLVALTELLKKRMQAMLPVLSSKDRMELIEQTMEWWMSLQSVARESGEGNLPIPDYTVDMSRIRKKGRSGMVQVMYLVRWWGTLVLESKMAPRHWKAFMADVNACLVVMVNGPGALPA
ncbi:uncharacterized protein EV420DRAFT_1487671 [Desarmillaria tabescens]|uniref:Uncharacterized protein n=1 Tax=Armillaria tabescens TaxID=1929756 RepID=A0AA39J8A3_ARMTA|nr:uncharacterized protein EV420DRAFT_1487671 [Desarmillaria tabescens]KAK0436078.1 hypothetical protein EV420DRAFT_1487671 [Desarmillaria tabescens]